jgi:hypothetical protein
LIFNLYFQKYHTQNIPIYVAKKIFIAEQAHDPSSAVESSVKKTDSYKLYFWDWLASRPHQVKAIEETTSGLVDAAGKTRIDWVDCLARAYNSVYI